MPNRAPIQGVVRDDGKVTCPSGHFCGVIDAHKTQFYCDSCKAEVIVQNPTRAYLAKRLLDSHERIIDIVASLPV